MIQFISAISVLGIVILGLLIMTNAVSAPIGRALSKTFLLFVPAVWAVCILEGLLPSALSALKTFVVWIGIALLAITAIVVLAIIIMMATKRLTPKTSRQRGEE